MVLTNYTIVKSSFIYKAILALSLFCGAQFSVSAQCNYFITDLNFSCADPYQEWLVFANSGYGFDANSCSLQWTSVEALTSNGTPVDASSFSCGDLYLPVTINLLDQGVIVQSENIYVTVDGLNVQFLPDQVIFDEGAGSVNICVKLYEAFGGTSSNGLTTVVLSPPGGTATLGTDYNGLAGGVSVEIPDGSFFGCVSIDINPDLVPEPDETILISIVSVDNNAFLGAQTDLTITILDSDDVDGDGVNNNADNCPNTSNPNQEDLDGDGIGNVCDSNNAIAPPVVVDGNIYLNLDNSGAILRSPSGHCFLVTVSDSGVLQTVPVTCPQE